MHADPSGARLRAAASVSPVMRFTAWIELLAPCVVV